jgi:acyl carrier protein
MEKQKLLEVVNERLSRSQPLAEEDYETPFNDLGIDSLDRMLVFVAVQEAFGVSIPDDQTAGITSLKTLEEKIADKS